MKKEELDAYLKYKVKREKIVLSADHMRLIIADADQRRAGFPLFRIEGRPGIKIGMITERRGGLFSLPCRIAGFRAFTKKARGVGIDSLYNSPLHKHVFYLKQTFNPAENNKWDPLSSTEYSHNQWVNGWGYVPTFDYTVHYITLENLNKLITPRRNPLLSKWYLEIKEKGIFDGQAVRHKTGCTRCGVQIRRLKRQKKPLEAFRGPFNVLYKVV